VAEQHELDHGQIGFEGVRETLCRHADRSCLLVEDWEIVGAHDACHTGWGCAHDLAGMAKAIAKVAFELEVMRPICPLMHHFVAHDRPMCPCDPGSLTSTLIPATAEQAASRVYADSCSVTLIPSCVAQEPPSLADRHVICPCA
jgi:hypothetical protein